MNIPWTLGDKSSSSNSDIDTFQRGVQSKVPLLLECRDYFLAHPPIQPKKEIAEYVRNELLKLKDEGKLSNDFDVPEIYATLQQAIQTGGDFIIRSDFPNEYNGDSGINNSPVVLRDSYEKYRERKKREFGQDIGYMNLELLERYIGGEINIFTPEYKDYPIHDVQVIAFVNSNIGIIPLEKVLQVYGIKNENFANYTFWKYVHGKNVSMTEDRDKLGRYYIKIGHFFIIIENGEILFERGKFGNVDTLLALIEFYQIIKGFSKFDTLHTPIMEFQVGEGGKIYFLQYHRGNGDIVSNSPFKIKKDLGLQEYKTDFVRGKTGPEGIILNIPIFGGEISTEYQEGLFIDRHSNKEIEKNARRRIVHITTSDINNYVRSVSENHMLFTSMFKSQIFLCIPKEFGMNGDEDVVFLYAQTISDTTRKPYYLKVKITSDGDEGYIQILTPYEKIRADYNRYVLSKSPISSSK